MVTLSKYLVEHLSSCSCNELLHPQSCQRAVLQNLYRFALSNMKYYLPMALLHLLRRMLNGFNVVLLQDALWYYAQMVFSGLVLGILISTSICSLRYARKKNSKDQKIQYLYSGV